MYALFLVLFSCFSCSACMPIFGDGKMMTYPSYQEVEPGQGAQELIEKYGKPYEMKTLASGRQEFLYIEHVSLGRLQELMREYVFTIEDGRVVAKKMTETKTSPVQFTSD